jgi:muconate cycloisomerase
VTLRITGCEVFVVALPMRREHTWATKMQGLIGRSAIVRLDTQEGLSGWGEAPAIASWGGAHGTRYGETPETVRHIVDDHLVPAIVGLDPAAIGSVHEQMDIAVKGHPYAKAAVDIACYDVAGKAQGVSVSTMLGGARRERLDVVHSLGIMPVERCLDEAEQARSEGIRTFKCKTGRDPERDVEIVRAMRERLGDDVRLRVDGNEGYRDPEVAIAVTRAQQQHGLWLSEQPVEGIEAMAYVAARVDVPLMADESAWDTHDILALHARRAASYFSCYVTKPGGLYHARRQAELADALGMSCDIGGSAETGIGNAANLHLGAAMPNVLLPVVLPVTSLHGEGPEVAGRYYLDDIVAESFAYGDGSIAVPAGPGLGIEVDVEKLARYAA